MDAPWIHRFLNLCPDARQFNYRVVHIICFLTICWGKLLKTTAKGRGELKEDIKLLNHYVKEEEKQHRGDFIIQDALSFAKTTVNDK